MHPQDFIYCVAPIIFEVSFSDDAPVLTCTTYHSLLEEFLPQFYYSEFYTSLKTLVDDCRVFRLCALNHKSFKLFSKLVADSYPSGFKYDFSEVCVLEYEFNFTIV